MKTKFAKVFRILAGFLAIAVMPMLANAQQNNLTQTSLSAAITSSQTVFNVASATNITGQGVIGSTQIDIYVDQELMGVLSVSGTTVHVTRGQGGTRAGAHISGAMVLAGQPNWFYTIDPKGACTTANIIVSPYVNVVSGNEWLCSTVIKQWVPGFGNPGQSGHPIGVTTAVASAAGLVTPSGPLFHITGALAITGFNIPVGFHGSGFCVIPDGAFTTTNANNIAIASTGVVSKTLCFTYDANAAKPFFPSY